MLVVGAKGFAKELAEIICQQNPAEDFVFYDDINKEREEKAFGLYDVVRNAESAANYFKHEDKRFVLGIGSPEWRYKLAKKFIQLGGELTSVISPFAHIGRFENKLGNGITVMTNAVIETSNDIGEGCLIHHAAFVSHDVKIGKYCEISPSANLLGNTTVGDFCSVGTGAVILPKIKIGSNVIVGAGAVVTKDVPDNSMIVGVPGIKIKELYKIDE